jgi:hypothetical protein
MQIELDTAHWPVPVVRPKGEASGEELKQFLADYSALIRKKREAYVLVIDLRMAADLPAAQRKIITDYMQKQEEFARAYCRGTVLVFSSVMMRALLTGILWVRRPPQPLHIAATLNDANTWALKTLQGIRPSQPNVSLPPG